MQESDLNGLIAAVSREYESCSDFSLRRLTLNGGRGAVFSIREMSDKNFVGERVIRPLLLKSDYTAFDGDFDAILQTTGIKKAESIDDICDSLCTGSVCVAVEGENSGLHTVLCPADSYFGRSVGKSDTDVSVKGPQAGLVDDIEKNVCLLRRIIRSSKLKSEEFTKGSVTKTRIVLLYVDGRASEKLVAAAREKLTSISASVIVDSANIEMLMNDRRYGFFPTFGSTEKADKAASLLGAGRVVIMCDGSPFVLTAPYVFMESIQAAEDYLRSPYYATFARILRLLSLLTALYLPSAFYLLADKRPDLLPGGFAGILEKQRADIPLELSVELFIMLLVFEMLREVGVRMPQPVGNAVGIVGSFIIGDAATEAGVASASVILIVAISAVANFVVPQFMNTTVLLRFLYLGAACAAGITGLTFASGATLCLICSKKQMNTPYMSNIEPFRLSAMLDFLIAIPQKVLGRKERP